MLIRSNTIKPGMYSRNCKGTHFIRDCFIQICDSFIPVILNEYLFVSVSVSLAALPIVPALNNQFFLKIIMCRQ
jgi:hypothetical protein